MKKALDLISAEVQNHIRLAELLQNRNEELSKEIVSIKNRLKLEEKECNIAKDEAQLNQKLRKELSYEIEKLRHECDQMTAQLQIKERECNIAKDEAQLNEKLRKKISSETEDLQDRCDQMTAQLQIKERECNIAKDEAQLNEKLRNEEIEKLQHKCNELAKTLKIIQREPDSSRNSSSSDNVGDFLRSHSQRLGALQKTLERHLQLEQSIDCTLDKKTYVVFLNNMEHKRLFADNNVQFIHDPEDVSSIVANSHKEMFLLVNGGHLDNSNSDNELKVEYEKILSICQKWKELRPDGEIHVIGWNWWDWNNEIIAISASYHKINRISDWEENLPIAVSIFWKKYYKQLLSDVLLEEYLSKRDLTDNGIWLMCFKSHFS